MYYVGNIPYDPNYVEHFGILGMKWGVRRWQYKDGRFNEAGKVRYFGSHTRENTNKKETVALDHNRIGGPHATKEIQQRLKKAENKVINAKRHKMTPEEKKALAKKIAIGAGIVAATGLVAYVVYSKTHMGSTIKLGEDFVGKIQHNNPLFNLATMDDTETILEKGAELHRMHGYADFDPKKVTSPLYAAFEKDDIDTYKTLLRDWAGTKERYDVTLKALNTIKSPGSRTRAETFIDLWNNNSEYRQALAAEYSKAQPLFGTPDRTLERLKAMAELDPDQLYQTGIWALVKPGKAADIYIDAIKKKGYNAIVDDHDIMDRIAKTPIILLDASNDVVKTGQHLVKEDEYVNAFMNLINIHHPQVQGIALQKDWGYMTDENIREIAKNMFKQTFK